MSRMPTPKALPAGRPGKRVRTRTRLQMEETECGAAALGIVLEHFGSYVPPVTLRSQCGVSRDGSKASNVLKAARFHALEARGFKYEPADLRNLPMPVIVHWDFNHFLVVEGFKGNRVYLNDPASGRRQVTVEEFDRSFTGVALTFAPTEDFVPVGVRPRLLPSLLERLRGARGAVLFLVLAGLGLVLTGLAVPVFSQVFVDNVLVGGRTDWLTALLIGMAGTAVLRAVLTWLKLRYLVRLHMRLAVGMSSSFLWHVLRLPIAFFSARSPGDLASRVELNEGVAGLLSGSLAEVALDLVLVVFYLALIAVYDLPMAAVAVMTALIYGILLVIQERSRVDDSLRMSTERGRMQGIATGGLAMIETLKATGSETAFFSRWAGHQAKLADSQQRATRRDQLFAAFTDGFARVNALVVLGLGALRVMDGQLSLGGLVALQSLMASFLGPIAGLTSFGMMLQSLRGSVERMDDVLGHAPDDHGHSGRPHRRLTGALAVQGVTFGYSPLSPPLIDGVDLTIEPGQRVALIGSSGSGKSTMARLVCGLIRPWSGQILLDEQPYHSWPRSTLAASLAVVDQDITLFEGSVRDNLTLWDPSIPDADLYRAAKDACIHEDILRLPGGYDAQVGEGGFNFSGGQRQRLEIARALVGQPALLVLDEATSALDPETEHQVNQNLRRRGVSCLIVAHRLSTIRDCDEIVVLDQGRVVERGTHAQLLGTGARYRQLVAAS
jgi:NHLM bacteriocin system ABC transporter peptidase/ATP-binding protein